MTFFCSMPLLFQGGMVLLNHLCKDLWEHLWMCTFKKKNIILRDGTRLMVLRSEMFQVSTEDTCYRYWKHHLLQERVVLPVLFCLTSQPSWPFGWLPCLSTDLASFVWLSLLCDFTHCGKVKELLLCDARQKNLYCSSNWSNAHWLRVTQVLKLLLL